MPQGPGWSELLRGETDISLALRPAYIENLWVISAGDPDQRAIALLKEGHARTWIDRFRQDFELILFDCPPISHWPGALLLGENAEGIIFIAMYDFSRYSSIESALRRLASTGTPVVGAALVGYPVET